jgi:hypothetical protein
MIASGRAAPTARRKREDALRRRNGIREGDSRRNIDDNAPTLYRHTTASDKNTHEKIP